MSAPGAIPSEIFFINSGMVRVIVSDKNATEQSMHFALENQFIAHNSAFIQLENSIYTLRTEEPIELGCCRASPGPKIFQTIAVCCEIPKP